MSDEEYLTWDIVRDEATGLPKLPHWMYWEIKTDSCRTHTRVTELKIELHNTYTKRVHTLVRNKFGGWFGRPEQIKVEEDTKFDESVGEGWLSDLLEIDEYPGGRVHGGEWHPLYLEFDTSEDQYQLIRPIADPTSEQIYELATEILSRFLDAEVKRQEDERRLARVNELVGKYPPKKLAQEEK